MGNAFEKAMRDLEDATIRDFDPGLVSGIAGIALGPMALPLFALERATKAFFRFGQEKWKDIVK